MEEVRHGNLKDAMTVNGTFFLADGILDTHSTENNALAVTGTFETAGGTFNANASTITAGDDFFISASGVFMQAQAPLI